MAVSQLNKTGQKKVANSEEEQMEMYRQHVIRQEFGAREAKAIYEKYYFTIEADKFLTEYNEVMKKNFELIQKQREDMEVLKEQAIRNSQLMQNAVSD